nr:hypothetical protein Iba_chr10fCG7500 [Ipomoea batatas]
MVAERSSKVKTSTAVCGLQLRHTAFFDDSVRRQRRSSAMRPPPLQRRNQQGGASPIFRRRTAEHDSGICEAEHSGEVVSVLVGLGLPLCWLVKVVSVLVGLVGQTGFVENQFGNHSRLVTENQSGLVSRLVGETSRPDWFHFTETSLEWFPGRFRKSDGLEFVFVLFIF